ncbi:MAG: tetratricopeptide repeat protein [Ignavibacteria bacterium]|nr:tetratricopeptide repeat protein [Ignavibacteria bacterium]
MKNDSTSITKDLKDILRDYMTKTSVEELIKEIETEDFSSGNKVLELSELDKSQVGYDPPKGMNYRLLVDKIITHSENHLEEEKYFNLLLDIAQLMLFAGEMSYSLEIAQNLKSNLESNNNLKSILAETNLMISKIYWSQANWEDCEFYISEATRIFAAISSKSGLAKCENMLGTFYGEKGEFDNAQKHLENALTLLETDDLSSHAMILTNLGIINTINEDYEKAIWNYKNAADKFEKLDDVRRLSRVYHNLGMLYSRMENYDAALEEFNKCITVSMDNNYLSNCTVAYIGKAYVYTKLKNSALADAYTDKAMEIAYKINDTLSIADIYKIKGMIQNDMDNFQLSEEFFENSIRLNNDIESKLNEAESSAELGTLLRNNGRENEAKPYLESAIIFFKGLKNENLLAGLVAKSI